jgi:hypothetical protein
MLNKTEQSDHAPNPNEKPGDCYCSALQSGLCLPCYMRWLRGERPSPGSDGGSGLPEHRTAAAVGHC